MERPMIEPGPVVTKHAAVFRDEFEHHCQFRHVQHDLTGLLVLPNKRMTHMARGILDSADNTHRCRIPLEAPWRADEINRRRIRSML
jgi:hypothetical protein